MEGCCRLTLVAGMHRSGTSAVAGALRHMGARLPTDLIPAADDNPDGFWESQSILQIHEEMLASGGLLWDDLRGLDDAWFRGEEAAKWVGRLREAVTALAGGGDHLVIKDPRLCRLLPVWSRLADETGWEIKVVIPCRNPVDVAASLHARSWMPRHYAVLLWLVHFIDAERYSRGHPRRFILYDELIASPADALRDLFDFVVPGAAHGQGVPVEGAVAFVNPANKHHDAGAVEVPGAPEIAALADAAYRWAQEAGARRAPESAPLDQIRARLSGFAPLSAILGELYHETAHAKANLAGLGAVLDATNAYNQDLVRVNAQLHEVLDSATTHNRDLARVNAELRDGLDSATARNQDLARANAELRDVLDSTTAHNRELTRMHAELHDVLGSATEDNRALTRANAELHGVLDTMTAQVRDLARANEEQRVALEAIRSSYSWRITLPLRMLSGAVRSVTAKDWRRALPVQR
jgi:hypothetical protein